MAIQHPKIHDGRHDTEDSYEHTEQTRTAENGRSPSWIVRWQLTTTHRKDLAGYETLHGRKAVSWLRRLVAGLSPRRPGFNPGSVHVGFVVDKGAPGQVFLRASVFPCQFNSTGAPLIVKAEKTSSSSQGCAISLKTAVRQ
jgi:hypothetical protein